MRKVKEDVLNSAMALLKGQEMVFKAFKSGIKLKDNSKQSEESKQLSNYNKRVLLKSDNNSNTSNGTSDIILLSDSDTSLFTSKKAPNS